jgi:hypothetical protein
MESITWFAFGFGVSIGKYYVGFMNKPNEYWCDWGLLGIMDLHVN